VWRWTLPSDNVSQLIHHSLDAGITTFDNADIYGDHQNERIFGQVLKRTPALRQKMQLITKCGIMNVSEHRPGNWIKHYNTSRAHIIGSVENSLENLSTDHIDLLLIHRPDPLMDPEEVARAFSELKSAGKVLHFGVSNFTTGQFEMLQSYMDVPLVTNQLEISLTFQDSLYDGTIDNLMRRRVAPMAWSPLGGGRLVAESADFLAAKAEKYQATPSQLLLAWLLRHPARIFPVIGTTKPERIIEAAGAVNVQLDLQDWFDMWKAGKDKSVP
jgi:predicted oxidoreductase